MLEDVAKIRRVVLDCGTVDLRKSIDGLAVIIGDTYKQNPFETGTLFLFCGKKSDRIKGLLWMGNGFLLVYKRFEAGSLSWPRTTQEAAELTEDQFNYLMHNNRKIVIYEYQKGRNHKIPLEFYKDYKGVLVTNGLQQYHLVYRELPGLVNAGCWAHARRDLSDAVKAADKSSPNAVRNSVAYIALQKIGVFYNADTELKGLSSEEHLQKRQTVIKPLVEAFFAWVKEQVDNCAVPPKSKKVRGYSTYSIRRNT